MLLVHTDEIKIKNKLFLRCIQSKYKVHYVKCLIIFFFIIPHLVWVYGLNLLEP